MDIIRIPLEEADRLVQNALITAGTTPNIAKTVSEALVAAEVDGQSGHGLSRVPYYVAQVISGAVDGRAEPKFIERDSEIDLPVIRIDASGGFAYPACALALQLLKKKAKTFGVSVAAITHSHHFGQGGYHVEKLASTGLIGILLGNTPKAMPPCGGNRAILGTNPIAFAAPRDYPDGRQTPLVIDLSLSVVSRGKVMRAAREYVSIPDHWAYDNNGNPTTDPAVALDGMMRPLGDAKGYALALMVEVLAAALTGANFGFEAGSFFKKDAQPANVGQLFIALDPQRFSGNQFAPRLEALLTEITSQPGARLPGEQKKTLRQSTATNGLAIKTDTYRELLALSR